MIEDGLTEYLESVYNAILDDEELIQGLGVVARVKPVWSYSRDT